MVTDTIELLEIPTSDELRQEAIRMLLYELDELSLEAARVAIRGSAAGPNEHVWIGVVPREDGRLAFLLDCRICQLELVLAQSAFDASIESERRLSGKCAGIVAMMREAPETEAGKHASFGPFSFWKSEDGDDAENWEALSKIWT
jgi:hypothetical protein